MQLNVKNVFIFSCKVELYPDGFVSKFDLTKGNGLYISNGAFEEVTWVKGAPEDRMIIYDKNGDELKVNAGNSYISIVDEDVLKQNLTIDDALFYENIQKEVAK